MSISYRDSIELFSGAGGLALGLAKGGFRHRLLVDYNVDAIGTLQKNHDEGQAHIKEWTIRHANVKELSFEQYKHSISIVAGGPPCQPFSLGGKHKAHDDDRDMFPEAVRSVREVQPEAFIFENVKGLLRKKFTSYFEYIILQLTYPTIFKKDGEDWESHLRRLEQQHTAGERTNLQYNVVYRLLNAADYGVPQKRERLFIVGFRRDLNVHWSFPQATHSSDALLWDKWISGGYWERNHVDDSEIIVDNAVHLTQKKLLKKYGMIPPSLKPWKTIRETIQDLPSPHDKNTFDNHVYKSGAKIYPGHTGSYIDEPAKVLKAGVHGVPGGENMIRFPDNSVRYFTVREAARIQTFPDDYRITGSWSECMRQIGNAVPVALAEAVAKSVYAALKNC